MTDDHHVRQGTALVRRAVRQRWGITDEHRKRIPEVLASIAESSEDDRARVGAAKVMHAMEQSNQEDDHAEAGVQKPETPNIVNVIKVEFDRGG